MNYDYTDILKGQYAKERMMFRESSEMDDTAELPVEEQLEEDVPDIEIGQLVKVIDAEAFTAEELEMDDDDFESFVSKVEEGEVAIVFNENDDNSTLVDIVFENGLEAFNIPKINLQITDVDIDVD